MCDSHLVEARPQYKPFNAVAPPRRVTRGQNTILHRVRTMSLSLRRFTYHDRYTPTHQSNLNTALLGKASMKRHFRAAWNKRNH